MLDQFTLSAFLAGVLHQISWELVQDVPSFQQFAVTDMLLAQQLYEENLYVNGTGTGQAQGLIGNTGEGVSGLTVGSDNYASELFGRNLRRAAHVEDCLPRECPLAHVQGHGHNH